MADPSWAPTLPQVGAYVISRTTDVDLPDGSRVTTFTADTYPTDTQVTGIVSNVCAWILAKVTTVRPGFEELAETAAALRTAGLIELAFPLREGDVPNASELLKQADQALDTLYHGQEQSLGSLSPVGSFPAAPPPVRDLAEITADWRIW